ncbi:hypothetical protein EON67_00175 [archaeon]|nr:MAG: hypothetical protein EON67_00175 [archaeon]
MHPVLPSRGCRPVPLSTSTEYRSKFHAHDTAASAPGSPDKRVRQDAKEEWRSPSKPFFGTLLVSAYGCATHCTAPVAHHSYGCARARAHTHTRVFALQA